MREYPILLYKTPGPHGHAPGFKYIGCEDEEQFETLTADGWQTKEALDGADNVIHKAQELADAIDEVSPATRAELEAKATELGIKFNARTKDETLAERIAEALG